MLGSINALLFFCKLKQYFPVKDRKLVPTHKRISQITLSRWTWFVFIWSVHLKISCSDTLFSAELHFKTYHRGLTYDGGHVPLWTIYFASYHLRRVTYILSFIRVILQRWAALRVAWWKTNGHLVLSCCDFFSSWLSQWVFHLPLPRFSNLSGRLWGRGVYSNQQGLPMVA